MRKSFIVILSILFSTSVIAQKPDAILGTWSPSKGDAQIKIERSGNKYHGTISWLKEPFDPDSKKPKVDKNNPEKSQQNKPIVGLRLLKDLVFDEDEWTDGTVYDPESGKIYSCTVSLKDANTMDMRGYIGFSLIGRSEIWTRVQ